MSVLTGLRTTRLLGRSSWRALISSLFVLRRVRSVRSCRLVRFIKLTRLIGRVHYIPWTGRPRVAHEETRFCGNTRNFAWHPSDVNHSLFFFFFRTNERRRKKIARESNFSVMVSRNSKIRGAIEVIWTITAVGVTISINLERARAAMPA